MVSTGYLLADTWLRTAADAQRTTTGYTADLTTAHGIATDTTPHHAADDLT